MGNKELHLGELGKIPSQETATTQLAEDDFNRSKSEYSKEKSTSSSAHKEKNYPGKSAGKTEGKFEGKSEGKFEGKAEGKFEGKTEGKFEGKTEGKTEGKFEGKADGVSNAKDGNTDSNKDGIPKSTTSNKSFGKFEHNQENAS
ncbi:Piso0_002668 [Millerozyma farinosa CBS 7064]|uniref:Piso0_002668 protein n=1 Tax=Pichia sorbitophila (strain ATCC MYA-4447 / BCRC 22081 / CBS 7064 / NBRC 10061 / NRRL Y-12695) TaxID=559304 RepID=G8YD76_PICSO|nr:Piso0_002668 [Millerozyma farinosa CBS 7064]